MTTPVAFLWGDSTTLPQLSSIGLVYDPVSSTIVSYGGSLRTQYGRTTPRRTATGIWEGLSEGDYATLLAHYLSWYDTKASLTLSNNLVLSNVLAPGADFIVTPRHNTYLDHWRYHVSIKWVEAATS